MGGVGMWAVAEWRRRWPGLIALAVLVALAGGVATALAAGARRAESSFARLQEETRAPNLLAGFDFETLGEIGDAHVDSLDALAAIDGVEGVAAESWWAIAVYPELDQPGVVTAFAIAPLDDRGSIAEPIVIDGDARDFADPDAIVINEEAVTALGLGVGSTMTMRTASPARLDEWAGNDGQFASTRALDGPTVEVRVVAVTRSEHDFGEDRFPVISFTEGFARAHREDIAHVVPAISLRADPARLDEISAAAESVLAPFGVDVITAPGLDAIQPSIGVETTTMWVAAAIAAAAGVLLVAQAVGRQLAATAVDHPTRRALGVTSGQLVVGGAMCVLPALLLGAVLVPGVAWALSSLFPRGVARQIEPDPGWRVDAPTLAVGATATAVMLFAAVVVMAAAGARRRLESTTVRNRLAGWVLARPAASLGVSFARDPAGTGRRSRAVAIATIGGIAVGIGGVVAVAALDASRHHLTDSPHLFGSPAELLFESNGTFGIPELVDATLAAPGVTDVTRHESLDEDTLPATGPGGTAEVQPEAYLIDRGGALPPVVDGRFPQSPDEVALGASTAAALGADLGDPVRITPRDGGTPIQLRVSGRAVAWRSDDTRIAFIVRPEALRQILCPTIAPDDCDLSTNNVYASVDGTDGREALSALGFTQVPVPATVARLQEVGPIPWYLAGFLCLLGAAGLAHGLVTALRRRRRDLAIARALGLPARRAAAALTWQAGLTAVLGAAAGVVGGAIVGPWLWQIIADDLGVIVEARLPVLTVVIAAAGTMVIAAALSLLPRWRAAHLSAAEGLRAE